MAFSDKPAIYYVRECNKHFQTYANDNSLNRDFFTYLNEESNPITGSAVRKVKILYPYMKRFLEDLKKCLDSRPRGERKFNNTYSFSVVRPIIYQDNPTDGVIVFTELNVNNIGVNTSRYYNYSGMLRNAESAVQEENAFFPSITANLDKTIRHDIKNGKERMWTPIYRGIRRLKKRTSLSFSRAVGKYICYDGIPLNQHPDSSQFIEYLASQLQDIHRPLSIQTFNSIEEIRKMYVRTHSDTPDSCMDSHHKFNIFKTTNFTNENDRATSVDFYGYCPNSHGVALVRGDTTIARTICWVKPSSGVKYYSRIYARQSQHVDRLTEYLKNQGYQAIGDSTWWGSEDDIIKFEIPMHYSGNVLAFPMPYFDDKCPYRYTWASTDRKSWSITLTSKDSLYRSTNKSQTPVDTRATRGMHFHKGTINSEYCDCTACGEEMEVVPTTIRGRGTEMFCSAHCVMDSGYTYYQNATQVMYVMNDFDMGAYSSAHPYVKYSNSHVAARHRDTYVFLPSIEYGTEGDIVVNRTYFHLMGYHDTNGQISLFGKSLHTVGNADVTFYEDKKPTVVRKGIMMYKNQSVASRSAVERFPTVICKVGMHKNLSQAPNFLNVRPKTDYYKVQKLFNQFMDNEFNWADTKMSTFVDGITTLNLQGDKK